MEINLRSNTISNNDSNTESDPIPIPEPHMNLNTRLNPEEGIRLDVIPNHIKRIYNKSKAEIQTANFNLTNGDIISFCSYMTLSTFALYIFNALNTHFTTLILYLLCGFLVVSSLYNKIAHDMDTLGDINGLIIIIYHSFWHHVVLYNLDLLVYHTGFDLLIHFMMCLYVFSYNEVISYKFNFTGLLLLEFHLLTFVLSYFSSINTFFYIIYITSTIVPAVSSGLFISTVINNKSEGLMYVFLFYTAIAYLLMLSSDYYTNIAIEYRYFEIYFMCASFLKFIKNEFNGNIVRVNSQDTRVCETYQRI